MKQIYPDLWQTRVEHPFPGLNTHAYLLLRDSGNILFYHTGHTDEYEDIRKLGGISRQYLSHRDEAGRTLTQIREIFNARLCCHQLEEKHISKVCPVDIIFHSREIHPGNIEIIPTPGHTDGSTSFLCESTSGKIYLFTGDTIYPDNSSWEIYIMPDAGGRESDMKNSLALLHKLHPDVVLSSASVGDLAFCEMAPGEWQDIVEKVLQRLP
jgi:glyoxylase-like metal-dependent hydrolase (beta-lactamase superfamily II)